MTRRTPKRIPPRFLRALRASAFSAMVVHAGTFDQDVKPVKTESVPVQISAVNQQGGATQRGTVETRVFLPGGVRRFRAGFVNDEGLAAIPENARFNNLLCDPASGAACVDRILTGLARRGYRRPVAKDEVAELTKPIAEVELASRLSYFLWSWTHIARTRQCPTTPLRTTSPRPGTPSTPTPASSRSKTDLYASSRPA